MSTGITRPSQLTTGDGEQGKGKSFLQSVEVTRYAEEASRYSLSLRNAPKKSVGLSRKEE